MRRHVQAAKLADFVLGCLSRMALGMLMTNQSGHSSFNRCARGPSELRMLFQERMFSGAIPCELNAVIISAQKSPMIQERISEGGVFVTAVIWLAWKLALEENASDDSPLVSLKANRENARRSNSSIARLSTESVTRV